LTFRAFTIFLVGNLQLSVEKLQLLVSNRIFSSDPHVTPSIVLAAAANGGDVEQNGAESALMQADSPFSSSGGGGRKDKDKKRGTAASAGPGGIGGKKNVDDDDDDLQDEGLPKCPQVAVDSTSCAAAAADLMPCKSDRDCSSFTGRKCCHDGCRLACLVAVLPPPCMCLDYSCQAIKLFNSVNHAINYLPRVDRYFGAHFVFHVFGENFSSATTPCKFVCQITTVQV